MKMNDSISRKDAIALVDRPITPTGDAVYDNAREDERASIKDDLALLPSAEPKTGEWIQNVINLAYGWTAVDTYSCSECMEENNRKDNYCPNCGADMRG